MKLLGYVFLCLLKEGKAKEKGEQDKKRCEDRNAAAIRLVSQNLAGKAIWRRYSPMG